MQYYINQTFNINYMHSVVISDIHQGAYPFKLIKNTFHLGNFCNNHDNRSCIFLTWSSCGSGSPRSSGCTGDPASPGGTALTRRSCQSLASRRPRSSRASCRSWVSRVTGTSWPTGTSWWPAPSSNSKEP